ncbi:unnamed protein product [Urochloa humidicola]
MEATALSVGKSVLDGALRYAKSAIAEEVALQLGVRRDQAFITEELESMQSFLMAAHEERDEHRLLNTWVKQVRNVSYDVEDCLMDSSLHLRKPSWWRPRTLRERHRIAKEMKDLRARVEDVSQRNLRYHLIKGSSSKPVTAANQSSVTAAALFGVDGSGRSNANEENKKLDLLQLVSNVNSDLDLGVIAVWGRNGDLGNTSIIRAAYDSDDVQAKFPFRAWVRLTHPFNPLEFLQSLLRQFYEKEEIGKRQQQQLTVGLEVFKKMEAKFSLVDEINRFMTTERFLVVITELTTVEDWDWIKTYFPDKKNGSRIILSTLQIDVPRLCVKRPYKVSEIQQCLFDDVFYVFHKEVRAYQPSK